MQTIDTKSIKKILDGDRRILESLYEAYFPEISRFIRFRVNTQELADDLTGNVFTKTFEYIYGENTIDNVRAFLYRVAKNEIGMFYRDRKVETELSEDYDDQSVSDEALNKTIDFSFQWQEAENVLKLLREDWREIVFLRYLEERTYEEISEITGKSSGAIRVILHRAIQELKSKIVGVRSGRL